VRGLRGEITGAVVQRTRVYHPDVLRERAPSFRRAMVGRRFTSVGRRGKNIVVGLDPPGVLLVNLGMTGRLLLAKRDEPAPATHPAVRFHLNGERSLVFNDVRRFGVVERLSPEEWEERSSRLGPEPLSREFTVSLLGRALAASRSPIRSWLLDQRRLAGVGNIYANEALYRAGVDPRRPADSLTPEEVAALHREMRQVLTEAIRARGTTLRDYRDSRGGQGGFGPRLEVYGRDGEPCPRCNGPIQRIVFGNRSAFVCSTCQR
jgi:formamidopyrimidine-DNA glycosylase